MSAAVSSHLAELNIVSECRIKVFGTDGHWVTLGTCIDTPRHINDFMKAHKMVSCWAFSLGCKEYWLADKELARRV